MEENNFTASKAIIKACKPSELPQDVRGYIFLKWMRSLRTGNKEFKKIEPQSFYQNYKVHISNLLSKPDSIAKLAILPANEDGPEVILGFSISREDVLDYIFVQKEQRKQGIARSLLPNPINVATHTTMTSDYIQKCSPIYRRIIFNPYI